jgi:nucleotide-binding universal stress UspA family protein
MIRTALIALDGSAASRVATETAIAYVKRRAAGPESTAAVSLTGLAVLDRPTITKPQATPPGAGAFKRERNEAMLAAADSTTREILSDFEAACSAAGIAHTTLRAEGLPSEAIASAGHAHDLIVIGRSTNFQFQTSDDPCETFRRLVRDHPCPVVVTPDALPQGNAAVIAYDGSRAAARALHTCVHMGLNFRDMQSHVVSIDRDQKKADAWSSEAAEFLHRHDVEPQVQSVASADSPTSILTEMAGRFGARLVVMGAFGRKGLQAAFFGSTTRSMLDHCQVPLFMY